MEIAPERINRPFGPPYFKLLAIGEDRFYWTSLISKRIKRNSFMTVLFFDLAISTQAQVREAINNQAKAGHTAGIYFWINKVNGKYYVGSTMNFYNRITSYFYLTGAYGIIRNALIKYGFQSFSLVLIYVPNPSKDLVLSLEQYMLDKGKPEYNLQSNANSSAGRTLSEEHKAKISASRKNMILSEEHKAKLSTSLKGEKSPRFNKGTPVYLYEVHSTKLKLCATFPNRFRAAAILDIPASTLFNYIKNRTLFLVKGISYIISRDGSLT
jgi:group I intron endonuclease